MLNKTLEIESDKNEIQIQKMQQLEEALNSQLADKVAELQRLNDKIKTILSENQLLDTRVQKLDIKLKDALGGVGQFRSEFFAKLRTSLGDRSDIRIVGDRFVFQSEVLFAQGSYTIEENGKKQLEQLAGTLLEIANRIPKDVNWILRVDGHTDSAIVRPNAKYKSNRVLSALRAISVVEFLISKGIPENRLVAAGFGEHQPIEDIGDVDEDASMARNRRIEFKLDQR
jgi:chemotaxis protein MotB